MAKLRGKQKYKNRDLFSNLMAAEILLDSLLQKDPDNRKLSRALGYVRSCLRQVGYEQKTLKRWINPAPNQLKKK